MKKQDTCSRRRFCSGLVLAAVAGISCRGVAAAGNRLAFEASGKEFVFDTGRLKGTLRAGGKSKGLSPVVEAATGGGLAGSHGIFSHYRLLDPHRRYGTAAWDWASEAKLLAGGELEVQWKSDEQHPFDLAAVYRLAEPNIVDVTTRVVARGELQKFEVFLASYFSGFPLTRVYTGKAAAGGKPGFTGAAKADGAWHMFPRDEAAVKIIQDGRWQFPPHPVAWTIRPQLAAPLAIRRDEARGLAAVLMTRPQDCFAVACSHDEEGHRSVYFPLFGRDFKPGESAEAKSRLVLAGELTDGAAVELYETFMKQSGNDR